MTTKNTTTNTKITGLSEAALDGIVGGSIGDTIWDSIELHKHGYLNEDYSDVQLIFRWNTYSEKVDDAWRKAGVVCCTRPITENEYWIDGKRVSRKKALARL